MWLTEILIKNLVDNENWRAAADDRGGFRNSASREKEACGETFEFDEKHEYDIEMDCLFK